MLLMVLFSFKEIKVLSALLRFVLEQVYLFGKLYTFTRTTRSMALQYDLMLICLSMSMFLQLSGKFALLPFCGSSYRSHGCCLKALLQLSIITHLTDKIARFGGN